MRTIRNSVIVAIFALCASQAMAQAIPDPTVKPCNVNSQCSRFEFCEKQGVCGPEFAGQCKRRPVACARQDGNVTACDGRKYDSNCRAHMEGVTVPDATNTAKN